METYIAYPQTKAQSDAVKAVFKALGIAFKKEKVKKEEDFFTAEMYRQIEKSINEYEKGNYKELKTKQDVQQLLGI